MSKSKTVLKIIATVFGLVGFGILAVGSDNSKSSSSSSPANSAAPSVPAETKAPVAPVNVVLSDANAVLNAAIELKEDDVAPIWGEIPGSDEFEKQKNKGKMPQLKTEIKGKIYRIDMNHDIGDYNFKKKAIPFTVEWPANLGNFFVSDHNTEVLTSMCPEEQAEKFGMGVDIAIGGRPAYCLWKSEEVFANQATGAAFRKLYYIPISKKSFSVVEPDLDKAKTIKDDIQKVVLTLKIQSGWKRSFSDVFDAHCLTVTPLFLYVFGSKEVIYATLPWPKQGEIIANKKQSK